MDVDNITFRVRQHQRANSLGNLSDSVILDTTRNSLPDTLLDQTVSITLLQDKITNLEKCLLSANDEIDKLLLENDKQKKDIEKCNRVIDIYKKIESCESFATPSLNRKRKKPRLVIQNLGSVMSPINTNYTTSQIEKIEELQNQILQLSEWLQIEREKNKECEINTKNPKKTKTTEKDIEIKFRKNKNINNTRRKITQTIHKLEKKSRILQNRCLKLTKQQEKLNFKIIEAEHKLHGNMICSSSPSLTHEKKNKSMQNEKADTDTNKDANLRQNAKENVKNGETIPTTMIISDEMGRNLGRLLTNNISRDVKIFNHCKPGADAEEILQKVEEKTKQLTEGDTLAIIITRYLNRYSFRNKFIKLIGKIVEIPDRRFNIIVTSFLYNGTKNNEIYNLNNKIVQMVTMNENMAYIDINSNRSSYGEKRHLLATELQRYTKGEVNFKRSSALTFIRIDDSISSKQDKTLNFHISQTPQDNR